ncbi:MAG: hypothetical protein ACKOXP_07230 [Flavobacteriales bacterium]
MSQLKSYAIAFIFVCGSFLLGEFYPFTKFPMYSSFPNYSYVFYLTDSKGTFVPLNKYNMYGGAFSHVFFSTANDLQIQNGYGKETKDELSRIGQKMMHRLELESGQKLKNIQIHRIHFFHRGKKIVKRDQIIYALR